MRLHPLSLLTLVLAGAVACVADLPTAPAGEPDRPQFVDDPCGNYTPTYHAILVDSLAIFDRENIQLGCAWRYAEITPANRDAGFSVGSGCSLYVNSVNLVIKVRGCDEGTVQVKIYTDSTKTSLLQTLTVDIGIL